MKSIICIPGTWIDRSAIIIAIANNTSHEYLLAGNILLNIPTGKHFEVEICDRDTRMTNSFKVAGLINQVTQEFLEEIDKHTNVVYLIGEGGNIESAEALAKAGHAILKAGGIGIKVETAGKAFMKEQWTDLLADEFEASSYKMFVLDSITAEDGTVFSCGMHNLGLKDTIVSDEPTDQAVELVSIFSYYQIIDKPTISSNQTFSQTAGGTVYRITEEPNPPNSGHELFDNPFGMWRLRRRG
jgi:hypothetical protein